MRQMEPPVLVSSIDDISSLFPGPSPSSKYEDLRSQFSYVRKIRGDGNCFYRAFCFAYLRTIQQSDRLLQRFRERIVESARDVASAGFDLDSFQEHLNTFLDVVEKCHAGEPEDTLLNLFNEQTTSDSLVQYLRLVTSAYLQNHADFFCNFVEAPNLKIYCKKEVEAMSMECDHVGILALAQALDVGIHIVSMEGEDQLVHHIIPEDAEPALHLLYHTAHYDILY